ncbi:MAG: SDR family oxidoreductase [Deltaproteobacteria bacterium]|jgi:NAD(P)-dependent dehydrogenase (short-subunit alcohol dehydrogenase family)|nr:SDR family oxidoreductase [Deltaproteobacteria bacterium]
MSGKDRPLEGRTAWVTGAASGIGREIARRLHAEGARVGLLDLNRIEVETVATELGGTGVGCDVSDATATNAALVELEGAIGPPDLLVNAAGIGLNENLVGHDEARWHRVIDVNLTGPFLILRQALGGMMSRGFGRIVNISSGTAVRVNPGTGAYAASKAGLIALTKALAVEAAGSGVTANAVAPGLVDTPMTRSAFGGRPLSQIAKSSGIQNPMGRVLEPPDIAHAVAFLCHPDSWAITGQVLHVNDGAVMP